MAIRLSAVTSNGDRMDYSGAASEGQEKERLVIITWRDVLACSGWEKAKDVECPEILTVGWLIYEDTETIKLASTLDYKDFSGEGEEPPVPYGITAFPRGCVEKIQEVPTP
jgi:hypothetical protein